MKWVKWLDINQWKVNEYYDKKIDDLDKKNSTEANQNIYKEKKIVNLKDTKQNTIDQTKKSEDNHKVATWRRQRAYHTRGFISEKDQDGVRI